MQVSASKYVGLTCQTDTARQERKTLLEAIDNI